MTSVPRLPLHGNEAPTSPTAAVSTARGQPANAGVNFLLTPSTTFQNPFRTDFRKGQTLQASRNGERGLSTTVKDSPRKGASLATLSLQDNDTYSNAGGAGTFRSNYTSSPPKSTARSEYHTSQSTKDELSAWETEGNLATGPVLKFEGFVEERVTESAMESHRVRLIGISFYLKDGSVFIREREERNSGLPAGTILRRSRATHWGTDIPLSFSDFVPGQSVTIYGYTYHMTNCDAFTAKYLTSKGISLPSSLPLPTPVREFDVKRQSVDRADATRKRKEPFDDGFLRFLKDDKTTLRFYALWDDRRRTGGALHNLVMSFYVSDGTLEVSDVHYNSFNGKYSREPLLRRQRVPRDPEALASQTNLVTALSPRALQKAKEASSEAKQKYIEPKDLLVGRLVDLLGRSILIYDCDEYTRRYFVEELNVPESEMMPLESAMDLVEGNTVQDALASAAAGQDIASSVPIQSYPAYTGYGTEADSMQSVRSLHPEAPKNIALIQRREKYGNKYLNFIAVCLEDQQAAIPQNDEGVSKGKGRLGTDITWKGDRKYGVRFYLADDSIMVSEAFMDGGVGGVVLSRRKVTLPCNRSLFYGVHDLAVGGVIELNQRTYRLVESDAATQRLLASDEIHAEAQQAFQSAMTSIEKVLLAMPSAVARLQWLTSVLQHAPSEIVTGDELRAVLVKHKVDMSDAGLSAVLRKYKLPQDMGRMNVRSFVEEVSNRCNVPVSGLPTPATQKALKANDDQPERMAVLQDSARRQAKFKAAFKILRDAIFYRGRNMLFRVKQQDARSAGTVSAQALWEVLRGCGVDVTLDQLMHVLGEFKLIPVGAKPDDATQQIVYARFFESVEHFG